MTPHLDWFIRASVVLALSLLAIPPLRNRSAVARRLVLTVGFAIVLAIPILPSWHVGGLHHDLVARIVAEPSVEEPGGVAAGALVAASQLPLAATTRPVEWLTLVWWIGVLVVGARFVLGLVLARGLVRHAAPAPSAWEPAIEAAERASGLRAVVRVSSEIEAPAVTGIVSPVAIVPTCSASWTDERKTSVLLHELAHVAARDLVVQVLATMVCALHWFNPLVWLAARRLRLERELAADEAVLRSGVRPSSYAADLLAIAGAAPAGTIAIGDKPLAKRITAIVAEKRPPILEGKRVSALVITSATIAAAAACTAPSESASPKGVPQPADVPAAPARDGELQAIAETELDRTVHEWNAASGTILVMSPKGEVLADAGGHADDVYITGSTVKPLLLAAAIDEGVVNESDVFDCSRGERGGKILHDASSLGRVAVPEMLARSSNVGFAQILDRLGGDRFDRILQRFHFASSPALASAPPGDWDAGLIAIGATMSATPRQVIRAYATLAGGGEGIVKPTTVDRVSALLEGVVSSPHGTGKKARVAGTHVAGKTGSVEWTTSDGTRKTYASFVGYVPAEHPRYVIFVGVESPKGESAWGGEVAAPVFSRIAAHALSR